MTKGKQKILIDDALMDLYKLITLYKEWMVYYGLICGRYPFRGSGLPDHSHEKTRQAEIEAYARKINAALWEEVCSMDFHDRIHFAEEHKYDIWMSQNVEARQLWKQTLIEETKGIRAKTK